MFKLDLSKTFKWPVKFAVVDGNGRQQSHEIKLDFKRVTAEESKRILADIQQAEIDRKANEEEGIVKSPREQVESEADFLLQVVTGWEGVADENGQALDFNRDNLIALINAVPNLIGEIWAAFFLATSGGQKRKN